jgi:hypothetical protein
MKFIKNISLVRILRIAIVIQVVELIIDLIIKHLYK